MAVRRSQLPIPKEALLDCGAILGKRGAAKRRVGAANKAIPA